jgi:hypothetical protein
MALPTYDEAYTIPSPKAQLIALRTMQICAEETGAADTVDRYFTLWSEPDLFNPENFDPEAKWPR